MELTAFKQMPDELIRLIMEYARPTYNYLAELRFITSPIHQEVYREFKSSVTLLEDLRNSIPTHSIYRIFYGITKLPQYKLCYSVRNAEHHPREGKYKAVLNELLNNLKNPSEW